MVKRGLFTSLSHNMGGRWGLFPRLYRPTTSREECFEKEILRFCSQLVAVKEKGIRDEQIRPDDDDDDFDDDGRIFGSVQEPKNKDEKVGAITNAARRSPPKKEDKDEKVGGVPGPRGCSNFLTTSEMFREKVVALFFVSNSQAKHKDKEGKKKDKIEKDKVKLSKKEKLEKDAKKLKLEKEGKWTKDGKWTKEKQDKDGKWTKENKDEKDAKYKEKDKVGPHQRGISHECISHQVFDEQKGLCEVTLASPGAEVVVVQVSIPPTFKVEGIVK